MTDVKCSTCSGSGQLSFERGTRYLPCMTCSGSGIDYKKSLIASQSELTALREELYQLKEKFGQETRGSIRLQDDLIAAEQRNSELEAAIFSALDDSSEDAETGEITIMLEDYEALAVLIGEPTESGADGEDRKLRNLANDIVDGNLT